MTGEDGKPVGTIEVSRSCCCPACMLCKVLSHVDTSSQCSCQGFGFPGLHTLPSSVTAAGVQGSHNLATWS